MFKKIILLFFVLCGTQLAYSQSENDYPNDIKDFIAKRDLCEHFRGEILGDPVVDNARHINEQLDKYCNGENKALERLKHKYKNNLSITNKLNNYELIDCPNNCNALHHNIKFSDYLITGKVNSTKGRYTPNFAGHYYVSIKGCGGNAFCGEIIDAYTNKVVEPFPNAYQGEGDNGGDYFTTEYRVNSSLIIISGIAADTEVDSNNNNIERIYRKRYYNFINGKFLLLKSDIK